MINRNSLLVKDTEQEKKDLFVSNLKKVFGGVVLLCLVVLGTLSLKKDNLLLNKNNRNLLWADGAPPGAQYDGKTELNMAKGLVVIGKGNYPLPVDKVYDFIVYKVDRDSTKAPKPFGKYDRVIDVNSDSSIVAKDEYGTVLKSKPILTEENENNYLQGSDAEIKKHFKDDADTFYVVGKGISAFYHEDINNGLSTQLQRRGYNSQNTILTILCKDNEQGHIDDAYKAGYPALFIGIDGIPKSFDIDGKPLDISNVAPFNILIIRLNKLLQAKHEEVEQLAGRIAELEAEIAQSSANLDELRALLARLKEDHEITKQEKLLLEKQFGELLKHATEIHKALATAVNHIEKQDPLISDEVKRQLNLPKFKSMVNVGNLRQKFLKLVPARG